MASVGDGTVKDIPCYMHVNYLECALPLSKIFAPCAAAGYDGIEVRDRDRSGRLSLPEYLEQAHSGAVACGLNITFGCRNDTTNPDAAVRERSLQDFLTVIEFCGARGISTLNVFGGPVLTTNVAPGQFEQIGSNIATEQHWRQTVEYFQAAADKAAAHGITLCLETHAGYIHDLAAPARRLIEQIGRDNVRVNFDFGNIYLHPDNQGLEAEIALLAGLIGYVHLKNVISFRSLGAPLFFATPLRDGDIDNYTLLAKLFEQDYHGIITLENTMRGDKRHCVREDLIYLRQLTAEL